MKLYELKIEGLEARFFGGVSSEPASSGTSNSASKSGHYDNHVMFLCLRICIIFFV